MTTARSRCSMVRAQWTAWSERRSQAGASMVIIGVPPPVRRCCGAVNVSRADHTDTDAYAPLFWRSKGVKTGRSVDTIGSLVKVRSARRWGWSASRVQHHGFPREQPCAARSPTPTSCAAAGPPRRARASPIDINIAPRRRPQAAVLADRFSYPTDEASNARPGLRSAEPVDHTGRAPANRPTQRCDGDMMAVSYTHLRAHETDSYLVCRLLLEKKKKKTQINV